METDPEAGGGPGGGGLTLSTGIAGLDQILHGGLAPHRIYVVEGNPGSGKTTLGLQFLLEGARRGQRGLYVTLSEGKAELEAVAASHGWTLGGQIRVVELSEAEAALDPDSQFSMFHPSDTELNETTRAILGQFEAFRPERLVLDSLSELRLMAQSPHRFRRQVLGLKRYFTGRGCTVLLIDDKSPEASDAAIQSVAHGVIALEQLSPEFGAERRRLRVLKMRGQTFRGGYHDVRISHGGHRVYPRLVAGSHPSTERTGNLSSGIPGLDRVVGGGMDHGTSVLVLGPAGCGKSTLVLQYAVEAGRRGERTAMFVFEEAIESLRARARGVGQPVDELIERGLLTLQSIDPAELSPGEFADAVIRAAEGRDGRPRARVVVLDSLKGYINAMPEERFLEIQLHELLTHLGHMGVVSFIVAAQHGMLGPGRSDIDTSYLADTVLLLRYFEADGRVRQALSVVKRRLGPHERTIREFQITSRGLVVGEPLRRFRGVLGGNPEYLGAEAMLTGNGDG